MKILSKIKELFYINNQRGVVLPIILMAIGGLSLIGAAAIGVSTGEIGIANNDRSYKSALSMAESGVADVVDAIESNRNFMPRPLGAVNASTYSIYASIGDTGRYDVTVSVPFVAQVTATIPLNASSVVVDNPGIFNPGDAVIIGDTSTHILTRVNSINGNTLNLADKRGVAYNFGQSLPVGTYVAKNKVQIRSVGQAGTGFTSNAAVAGWRTIATINANPNASSGGVGSIRSSVTLQGDYSIQELAIIPSFTADVNQVGSTYNGPMFVTNNFSISPYALNSYSGPIFAPTSMITGNQLNIGATQNSPYNPIANGPTPGYPKVIGISQTAANNVNAAVTSAIAQVQASATCYQVQCGQASASQQIYYLDGYETDIYLIPLMTQGNPLLDQQSITPTTNFSPTGSTTFTLTVYIGQNNTGNTQQYQFFYSTDPILTSGQTLPTSGGSYSVGNNNVNLLPNSVGVVKQGNVVTIPNGSGGGYVTFEVTINNPGTGGYLIAGQNQFGSNSISGYDAIMLGMPSPSSGVREFAPGLNSTNIFLSDSGAGSHTGHATVATVNGTRQYIGRYATSDTTTTTSTTWVNDPGGDTGAVMYNGKIVKTSTMAIGEQQVMYTKYYIHTNAVGSCNDHDIMIVSKTIATYMGIAQRCNSETRMLFDYETVWNHITNSASGTVNPYNIGLQNDDGDPKLTSTVHKGYYEWVNTRDTADNELMRVKYPLIGDKEFLSVFNHPANTNGDFHSAIVNVNIRNLQMIGWSNPPIAYDSVAHTMGASVAAFPTAATGVTSGWLPTNAGSLNWDWNDITGIYSGFRLTSGDGFDLSSFAINTANYNDGNIVPYTANGNYYLPDMSLVPGTPVATVSPRTGTGSVLVHQWSTPGTWPGNWSNTYNVAMPANPIMSASGLPTTVITATISGPYFTQFQLNRGSANLFFDAANNIPFNVSQLTIKTRGGGGANITIGTTARPAAVYAGTFKLETDDCGGLINFNFVGKMTTSSVEMQNNVQYTMDTTLSPPNSCLTPPIQTFVYLKKDGWKEVR